METLAERIAPGDVDDLMSRLPVALHPPLKRGKAHTGGRPQTMSADEFLERVAQREGVDTERAREHAQAVFAVLREAVEEEFFDVEQFSHFIPKYLFQRFHSCGVERERTTCAKRSHYERSIGA